MLLVAFCQVSDYNVSMRVILKNTGLITLILKALNHKLYNRYSKEMWLIPVLCPDFLKRVEVEVLPKGVRLTFTYPTSRFLAEVVDPSKPENTKDQENRYMEYLMMYLDKLEAVDPSIKLNIPASPPKPLWEILYSLASLVFAVEIGREKPNLIAPITSYDNGKIVLELYEISKEEAKERIKEWITTLIPEESRQGTIEELIQEGLMTEDYEPLIRLNLLYEILLVKAHKLKDKPAPVVSVCPYCGKEFIKENPKAVFCSPACRSMFATYLSRHKLNDEYAKYKSQAFAEGLSPEEAVEKAVHHMIEKYPFLSKVKRQELGIVRKRGKKKKEPQPIHATQPPPEKVEEEDPLEILKQILFGEDQKE